ncbi:MAG TPA: phosphatidate cytidylyltransferase [Anaerolineales bacterium]
MLRRTLTAVLLLAIALPAAYFGGTALFVLLLVFINLATFEYAQMFNLRGYQPSATITLASVTLLLAARAFRPDLAPLALSLTILACMTFHLVKYESGRDLAAVDLVISLGAVGYLGWIGAYLFDLRQLDNGGWWLLLVFAIVWFSDSAAYFVGSRFGRHKIAPRLSPKKSWEGYIAGVVGGTAFGAILAVLLNRWGPFDLTLSQGIALGAALSTLTTLGDLGESLFKRFAGVKDSGNLLPGHGGAFDRIDSLIWAGVLGYYWIRYFII